MAGHRPGREHRCNQYHIDAILTGTVNAAACDVWVNGVRAGVSPNLVWDADNVPVTDINGMGNFALAIYSTGSNPNVTQPTCNLDLPEALPSVVQPAAYLNNFSNGTLTFPCGASARVPSTRSGNFNLDEIARADD